MKGGMTVCCLFADGADGCTLEVSYSCGKPGERGRFLLGNDGFAKFAPELP